MLHHYPYDSHILCLHQVLHNNNKRENQVTRLFWEHRNKTLAVTHDAPVLTGLPTCSVRGGWDGGHLGPSLTSQVRRLGLSDHRLLFCDHLEQNPVIPTLLPMGQVLRPYPSGWWTIETERKLQSSLSLWLRDTKIQNVCKLFIMEFSMDYPQGASKVVKSTFLCWFYGLEPTKWFLEAKQKKPPVVSLTGIPRTHHTRGHVGGAIWGEATPALAVDVFSSWARQASLAWLTPLA